MNIKKLLVKALERGNQQFDIKAFATLVSYAEAYGGGYIYSGETYYLPARQKESGPWWPELKTRIHYVKEYDRAEPEDFVDYNMRLLTTVQEGEVVSYTNSCSSGYWSVSYMRIGDAFISVYDRFTPSNECEDEIRWSAADDVKAEEDARYKREQALSREAQRAKAFSLGERATFKG